MFERASRASLWNCAQNQNLRKEEDCLKVDVIVIAAPLKAKPLWYGQNQIHSYTSDEKERYTCFSFPQKNHYCHSLRATISMSSSAPTSNPVPSESVPDDHAWETDHPYQKPDADFKSAWEGACHCGRVRYSLSREKPLASKYCHCTDCQRMHAVSHPATFMVAHLLTTPQLGPLPMGSHLPQIRPPFPQRRAGLDILLSHTHPACSSITVQGVLRDVSRAHHGRGAEHGDAFPGIIVRNPHGQGKSGLQIGGSHLLGK